MLIVEKVQLRLWDHHAITKRDVLELAAQLQAPVALAYSPAACRLVRFAESKWLIWQSQSSAEIAYDFAHDYELRIFSQQGEYRWLNDPATPDELGSASYMADSQANDIPHLTEQGWEPVSIGGESVERIENQYLLWGEHAAEASSPNWQCLLPGRIEPLYVPCHESAVAREECREAANAAANRVMLKSWEYIGLDSGLAGKHGNCAVIAERLSHFEFGTGVVCSNSHLHPCCQEL